MEKFELEKKVISEDGEEKRKEFNGKKKQLGGVRTMPFILANEICDRFAGAGFHANMITYLTQVLNLPLVKASNTLSNFGGTSNFTPLIGAFLADSIAGRFWTIVIGSIFYLMGMITITTSSILPQLRPPPCPTQVDCREASDRQLWVLYTGLLLTSLGTGGLRPCVATFAADQFDMAKQKTDPTAWNFFNWYFFSMGAASLLALTVVVYVQDNISWSWGLGIPTIAMALSLVAFVVGSSLYRKIQPGGSPYVRVAQVAVAAFRKRKIDIPSDPNLLYRNRALDARISIDGTLLHSDQFRCLDRAAVLSSPSDMKSPSRPNPWRLSTIHRVEELKTIVRILPIWSAAVLLVASHAHLGSFTIQQARTMDRHLSPSFQIPPASMSIFSILTVLVTLPLYDRLLLPLARRLTSNPVGITSLQRMGIGYAISIFGSIVSALVEIRRKNVAAEYGLLDRPTAVVPISVFWLVPQYCVHGLSEVFMAVGHMEFLYDQSPESMRSTASALYWIAIAAGNYLSTGMVSLVHGCTGSKGNWLPDRNLNRGKLENYYWLVTGVQAVNLVYYAACAWCYTYKPIGEAMESKDVESRDEDDKVRS
ncbi:major facilitator superfamily protein [Striga asiatica]|uniref:Major facilitator superfamily protein n=1 Tax=Striga asiatica TaxID=4170 RepID=A0A5A7R573_STRAF|nr:major facilitator superfamily protein [Striga asiatica]